MIAKAFIIVAAFTISVLITPSASQAQHRGHVPRVGYLGTSSASLESELVKAFREGLRTTAMLKDRISLSNTAGQKGTTSAFRVSSLTW